MELDELKEILEGPLQSTVNEIYEEARMAGDLDNIIIAVTVYSDRTTVGVVHAKRTAFRFLSNFTPDVVRAVAVRPPEGLARLMAYYAEDDGPGILGTPIVGHYAPQPNGSETVIFTYGAAVS